MVHTSAILTQPSGQHAHELSLHTDLLQHNRFKTCNECHGSGRLTRRMTPSQLASADMPQIIILMDAASAISIQASASRQIFAFARDDGTPFAAWLSRVRSCSPRDVSCFKLTFEQVSPRLDVPLNAVICSTTIACLLSLINIGSTVAFNSLISLTNGTLMVSYGMCIGCFVWRRLSKQPMLPSQFQLGRYGLLVNLLAMSFLSVVFVMVSAKKSDVRSPDLHILIER